MFSLTNYSASANPVVQAGDGTLYGCTFGGSGTPGDYGTVFSLTTNAGFNLLHSFTAGNDGSEPEGGVLPAADGSLYGTASHGGAAGLGCVFRITTNGTLTTLYCFTGGNDGKWPRAPLIQASDGNLYGTTFGAGAGGSGTAFRISTRGDFTTLFSFFGPDGALIQHGLLQATDGSLYGMTKGGGRGWGTVFRLIVPGADSPKIISTAKTGSVLTLNWLALRGRSYKLQSSPSLAPPNWTDSGAPVTATNSTAAASTILGPDPERFYRVALLP